MASSTVPTAPSLGENVPESVQALITGMKGLFQTGEYSDLTIRREGHEEAWKVHKVVVCTQSEVFKATLEQGAKLEGKAEKDEIYLDDEPHVIGAMLHYLYNFDYDDFGSTDGYTISLMFDVQMFIIADKYDIKHLGHWAVQKFRARSVAGWSTEDFADAVKEICSNGPGHDDSLQCLATEIITSHAGELLNPNEPKYARIQKVLRETEIGALVAMSLALRPKAVPKYFSCTRCGRQIFA